MDKLKEKMIAMIQDAVGGCARHWACLIADRLIANGVTLQGWIPVTESLPELENSPCDVLVLHELKGDLFIDVAWYSYDRRRWCSCSGMNLKVTHWMPLPELP